MKPILILAVALCFQASAYGAKSWNSLVYSSIFPADLDVSRSRSGHPAVLAKEFSGLLEDQNVVDQLYVNYLKEFNKDYSAFDSVLKSEETRSDIFKANLVDIATHNLEAEAGQHTWFKGVNQFTDLTEEEFQRVFTGHTVNMTASLEASGIPLMELELDLSLAQSSTKDWREDGVVTKVKNQENCGSCYAFTTCAALESQLAMQGTKDLDLSEQELVDCSKNNGCGGGDWPPSYTYMKNGVTTEAAYPYTSGRSRKAGSCGASGKAKAAYVGSYANVARTEDAVASTVVQKGPIAVGVSTNGWSSYKKGSYTGNCGRQIGHAVLLVGVTSSDYIIKNSWGEGWGDRGYIYLPRGKNQCMIKDDACVMSPK